MGNVSVKNKRQKFLTYRIAFFATGDNKPILDGMRKLKLAFLAVLMTVAK